MRSITVIVVVLEGIEIGVPERTNSTVAVFSITVPTGVPAAPAGVLNAAHAHIHVNCHARAMDTLHRFAEIKVHSFLLAKSWRT